MVKTLKNATGSELCDRRHCGHTHLLHGNGSKAHGYVTGCIIAGCECTVFLPMHTVPKEPRPRPVLKLDRAEPKLFDLTLAD